jgi:hypothetical protein
MSRSTFSTVSPLDRPIDMGGNTITGLPTPSGPDDLITKNYVDTKSVDAVQMVPIINQPSTTNSSLQVAPSTFGNAAIAWDDDHGYYWIADSSTGVSAIYKVNSAFTLQTTINLLPIRSNFTGPWKLHYYNNILVAVNAYAGVVLIDVTTATIIGHAYQTGTPPTTLDIWDADISADGTVIRIFK